jgi:tetratricopeptide (TPR) repeat protein
MAGGPAETLEEVISDLSLLGDMHRRLNQYDDATQRYAQALALVDANKSSLEPGLAVKLLVSAAFCYASIGKYQFAIRDYETALCSIEESNGAETPDLGPLLHDLAGVYFVCGQYEDATQLFERAVPLLERLLGNQNAAFANCLHNLACSYIEEGRMNEASVAVHRAFEVRNVVLGPESPATQASRNLIYKCLVILDASAASATSETTKLVPV